MQIASVLKHIKRHFVKLILFTSKPNTLKNILYFLMLHLFYFNVTFLTLIQFLEYSGHPA